jgi:hypothetical protein
MPKMPNPRKSRFRAALALAGLTATEWAEANDVTQAHLSQVLDGKRESRSLMEKVEAFTEKHLSGVAA